MKISKQTVDNIKRLYDINQGLMLSGKEKVLRSKTTDNTALAIVPIEEQFPRDFYIYDLKEFLSVLSIVPDANFDFSDSKKLVITSDDDRQRLVYLESDSQFVTAYTDKTPILPSVDLEVTVTEQELASVIQASSIMKLESIGFVSDGQTVRLQAFSRNNGSKNVTNQFAIELSPTNPVTEQFNMYYNTDGKLINVLLGEQDLKFQIGKGKTSKIQTGSGKEFWMVMNIGSSWGE